MTYVCEWCDEPATVEAGVEGQLKGGMKGQKFPRGYIFRACEAHRATAERAAANFHPSSEGSLADEMEAA